MPPAALCIHLCIGQAYAFSVFNKPMSQLIGITDHVPGDWSIPDLGWIFSLAIVCLGLSAAFLGRWVEAVGPRKAMFAAACLFCGGLIVAGGGVAIHNLPIVYLGYGVIGGCGLGIGYISPVSTLIKWFPDRPGMATGMAIMGFGGAAFIASPLSVWLMGLFSTSTHVGVAETFIVLGVVYAIGWIVSAWHADNTTGSTLIDALGFLSFQTRYQGFAKGLIDTRAIVYFASVTVLCLLVAFRSLESRKWS